MSYPNYSYSWEFSSPNSGGATPKPPASASSTPPAVPSLPHDERYVRYRRAAADGHPAYDLSPTSFQDYLLDLVNLTNITSPVGEVTSDASHTPVANWLRAQGLTLVFSDIEGEYLVYYHQHRLETLPGYLLRYLEVLYDDSMTERFAGKGIPAYQALALLSYVATTERYYDESL